MNAEFETKPNKAPQARTCNGRSRASNKNLDAVLWRRAELKALHEHAPILMCALDEHRRVICANRAFCGFAKMPEKELIEGRVCGVFGCTNALDDPRGCGFGSKCHQCALLMAIEDTLKTGRPHNNIEYNAAWKRKNVLRQVMLLASTVRFSVGKKSRLLLCLQDISPIKIAEKALRESEGLYRAVVEDQTEVISRHKPDGTLVFVNAIFCRFYGKDRKRLLGRKWRSLAVAKDLPMIEERLRMLTPTNPVITIENRVYSGTGQIHWMQFSNRGIFSDNGELVEIQSVGRDITERKRVERALHESELRFRALFEHSMAGILLTAPDGRVLAANPAACRLLGRTENEICAQGRTGIINKKDARIHALIKERSEKGYAHGEVDLIRGDGRRIPVYLSSAIFHTGEGLRSCMVMQDLTEIRQAEQHIRDFSQRLLSTREEEKRRLSALLHHEVGSLVVGVTARLNVAEADLRKGDSKQALSSLKETRRLFLKAARSLRNAALQLHPPDMDLLGLHNSLKQYFKQIRQDTTLHINFIDRTRSATIAPPIQIFLFRTVQECLNNVINHAKARRVRFILSMAKDQLQMTIHDDGKGFDPRRLYEKQGKHLGLQVIQEMAAMLNGSLTIRSKPGRGTKMAVKVPANN
jgi:two-component system, NarL family, sensor histidine kinase UhpB